MIREKTDAVSYIFSFMYSMGAVGKIWAESFGFNK